MKRNLNYQLVSLTGAPLSQMEPSPEGELATDKDGNHLPDGQGGHMVKKVAVPLLASNLIVTALLYTFPDEANLSADDKTNRYKLAKRVQDAVTAQEEVDMSLEDIILVKTLCGKMWAPIVVGQLVITLEG